MSREDLADGTFAGWLSHNAESGTCLNLEVNRGGEHSPCNLEELADGLLLQPV